MSALIRCPVAPSEATDCEQTLLAQAKEHLGYSFAADKSPEVERFEAALVELDIRPFSAESVTAYKLSQIPTNWLLIACVLGCFGTLAGMALFVVVGITLAAFGVIIPAGIWAAVLMVGLLIAWISGGMSQEVSTYGWTYIKMEDYRKPVPEFAIQTAVDLKKRCPGAKFYIDELVIQKTVDPFLAAWVDGKPYHLEVWNEPRFKAQRQL